MFNKLSTKNLVIIFGLLLVIVLLYVFVDKNKGERTFRSELIDIDTAAVTGIHIYPRAENHKEVTLFKENGTWKVMLDGNKKADVPESKIKNLFAEILRIKPLSVAAQSEAKWHEYEVDTAGTRVTVFESGNKVLDLNVGKYTFRQPRTMLSYVRVGGDDNVYVVNGLLGMAFNKNANSFRNQTIIEGNKDNWKKLTFSYPDSSFTMVKDSTGWYIGGVKTDSAKAANYLNSISHTNSGLFVDSPSESTLSKEAYTLTVESTINPPIIVSAFTGADTLIHSTLNPDVYFNGGKSKLVEKIFKGKKAFLK